MSSFVSASRAVTCVAIALFVVPGTFACAQTGPESIGLQFETSQGAPQINERFRTREGWIGGDGAQSVDLGNNRTLWLYGDTWVGTVKDGRRSRARIVHNSAGIQCGAESPCEFVVRRNEQGKPLDLISPDDGRGWFWIQSGVMVKERLYLFLAQAERSTDPLRPDFQPLGQVLAIVDNPQDDPLDWCVRQIRIPFVFYSPKRDLTYGRNAIVDGEHLYVYGSDDRTRVSAQTRFLVVARVHLDQIEEMSAWRFHRHGRWTRNPNVATHLADYMSGDISVAWMPEANQFLMVYTDCDISNRIVARTAPTPAGPWSHIEVIHTCQDALGDRKLYCFGGKAHPTLSSDGQLVISYLTSSIDTWQVATDARLFWPTFVTVGVRGLNSPEATEALARSAAE